MQAPRTDSRGNSMASRLSCKPLIQQKWGLMFSVAEPIKMWSFVFSVVSAFAQGAPCRPCFSYNDDIITGLLFRIICRTSLSVFYDGCVTTFYRILYLIFSYMYDWNLSHMSIIPYFFCSCWCNGVTLHGLMLISSPFFEFADFKPQASEFHPIALKMVCRIEKCATDN